MQRDRRRILFYLVTFLFLMSWMTPNLNIVQPAYAITFTVNTTSDTIDVTPGNGVCADGSGDCSLRAAIQEANAFAGTDTIGFNIPGAGTQVITLGSVLPTITQALTIAGSTQPGYSGIPLIVVDANGIGGNILLVSNTNANLENFRISNAAGTAVYLTNADNSVVDGLDLRWTTNTTRTGNGIYSDGTTGPVTIQNVRASTRDYGIRFANGSDVQLLNNELLDNNQAVYLVGITAGSLPGGVNIAGNEYTGSSTGLYFQNMANLIISDGSYPGTNVDVTDGSGNETLTSTGGNAIQLSSVDNSRITAVDLSWTVSTAQFGYGIRAETSIDNLIVDNIAAAGRTYGVYVNGGSDVQVLNSDLSRNSTWALQLSNITANALPRAVVVSGNDYSNSSNGLYLTSLNNQIISDGSVPNTNINLTDGSANHTLTTVTGQALALNNVDNTTIEAVNLSWLGDPVQRGYGINAEASSDNLTIQNIAAANRQYGVYANGGSDVRVLNSNLSNNSTRALQLQTITATTLPGGILVADNSYTNSTNGVYIANQNNLIVSDGSVPGTNVDLTNGGGNHTLTTITGTALEILNSDNLRVDSLNLSWTGSSSRSGSGLRVSNNTSDTVLVQNLTVNNRNMGVYVASAIDVRILNNNLGNNGSDTNNYALYLNTITANTLPGGVLVQGNDFSNSSYGVRLQTLSNLVISDGSVGGTNVNLTNGGGSHTLSTTNGYALHLNNIDNSTVEALNLSWTGTAGRSGTGLFVETNCDNLTLQNLSSTNRNRGIYVNGGTDVRVLNNDLSNNGADTNNFALLLVGVTAGSLPGGVQVAGNDFTNSDFGIRLQNLTNQVVSDGSVAGTTIDVTNGGGSHTLTTVSGYALFLRNLDNSVIEAVDVSWLGDSTQRGNGIYSELDSNNLTIQNVAAANRQIGIYIGGGSDVRVLNSNLSNNGAYALQLDSVVANTLPGGVQVAGNTYTGSSTGLYLLTLSNIVISDGSVGGTNINVTNGGGNQTLTTVSGTPILLNNVDNLLVDNIDLSWTGSSGQSGTGLQSGSSSDNVTLQNLTINNRLTGISITGGSDVRVLNNDLRQNGADTNRVALYLSTITANTVSGGVLVAGNDFSNSSYGVRIHTMSGLIISDGSVPGTNLDLTDGNGNHTLTTVSGYALLISNNSDNITVSHLDLSWTGSGSRTGIGLFTYVTGGVTTHDNLTISNVIAQNRATGLYLGNTANANVSCATILNNAEGIRILNSSSNALAVNNHFQANSTALRWDGAALLTAENNYWGAADGPSNLGGSGDSYTGNIDANPFLAARPTCAPLGVFEVTTTADTSNGDTSSILALLADPGADQAISLREAIAAANNTSGAQTINFNIGGGGAQTILLSSALPTVSDSVTINGASQPGYAGTTLITIDANGVAGVILSIMADNTTLQSLTIANAPGTAISLNGSDGSLLQSVNVAWTGAASGTGLDINNSNNVQVAGLTANNRVTGLNAAASNNLTVGCSIFQTNTTGFSADAATSALALAYSQIQGNGNGVSNAAASVLLAENNYWGAASGPFPLGGTGDNYTGNVDAAPFLVALPGCMVPASFVVTTINDVSDGDTSSIANLVASPGADGAISLREAIAAANNTAGTDTIGFNIGGGGSHTIVLGTVLPTLTDSVILDGSTQPGFGGTPLITIDGGFLSGIILTLQASNSTIRDLTIRNGIGTALALTNADNALLDNLNLSRTGTPWTGTGLSVAGGSDTVTIQNLIINQRATAISVNGGTDVQVLNNDLSNSGSTTAALYMIGVTANTLPGGVIVTGNTFANAATSVRFENMAALIISDGSVGGSNVIFTLASGLNTATNLPLYLRNIDNSSVTSLNLSWTGLFASGTGLQADTGSDNLIVQNNTITGRSNGIIINNGIDVQVLNNNLSNSSSWALQLSGITAGSLPGGVNVAGNTYSGSTNGVQLTTMANLVISDGSAPGTNVNPTNGGAVHTLTTVRGTALYLNNVDNSLITNVNLSWLGGGPAYQGTALQIIGGSDTVTVDTITANNRARGIYVSSGRDVQILNNNLNGSGADTNNPALYMIGVTSLSLPGGVVVMGNTFTNDPTAVRFESMADLIISDGSVGGSNVIFTLASGLNTVSGRPLYLNSVDNSSVTSVDLSWSGLGTSGTGLQASTSIDNLIVQNNTISNRVNALVISTGSDVQVLNNNLSNSSSWALQMTSITAGSLPGGINVADNNYSNSSNGVYLTSLTNLIISDGSVGGTNMDLTDSLGNHTLTTVSGNALQFNNVDNTTVSNLDLSWLGGAGWLGTGFYTQGSSDTVTLQNVVINNRVTAMNVTGGRDVQVLNNDLSNSGSNNNNPALYMLSVTSLSLPGGVVVTGNTFTNSNTAMRFENMANLVISDGSVGGSNVVLAASSGMTTTASLPLYLRNVDNSSVSNVDLSWSGALPSGTGLLANNGCDNLLIQNGNMSNRGYGVNINNGTNVDVLNNDLSGASTYGLYMITVASGADISGNDFTNDSNGIYLQAMGGMTLGQTTGLDTVGGTAITLYDVINSTVDGADISFSGPVRQGTGLLVQATNDTSSNNITLQNAIASNRSTGVNFQRGTNLTVSCTELLNNNTGVLAGQGGSSTNAYNVVLDQNWFQGNSVAVNNPDRTNPTPPPPTIPDPQLTNAENNYWGAANGPSNLGGSGDSYSGNVDADPFGIAIPLCVGADYGDLPAAYNLTTQADNGARHQLGELYLGNYVDFEKDGQESADAGRTAVDGDDGNKDDDEDGVAVVSPWQEGVAGGAVTVALNGGTGCLSGWIDWNNNASFADAGDQVMAMVEITAGNNSLNFDVPAGALPFDGIYDRFARFRVVPDAGTPNDCSDDTPLALTGTAIDGEVEDYYLRFRKSAPTGTGPGGVGTNDATSSLVLWLAATGGTGTTTNGAPVSGWADQSGFGYNATQATGANQPLYQGNVVNGQPVLRFDNVDDGMSVADGLSLSDPYAVMTVFNSNAAASPHRAVQGRDSDWLIGPHSGEVRHYAGGWVSTGFALVPGQFYIGGANNLGSASSFWVDGTNQTTNGTFVGSPGRIGLGATGTVADPLGGDLAEVIVYADALNNARRIIVENYLSAKYSILVSNDRYDGDVPGNGNFDLNVAGIGLEANGDNYRAHSVGMIVQDNIFLLNNGDYLLFGHNTVNNANTTADLPTGGDWNGINDVRWLRHWYVDVTDVGANNGTVDIIFDFSEASMDGGLPPNLPTSNYRLLKRTGTTGQFNDVTAISGATVLVVGDQVQFLGVNVAQLGSNFTLGSIDGAVSPTAITMQHVSIQNNPWGHLVLVMGALALLTVTVRFVWRRTH